MTDEIFATPRSTRRGARYLASSSTKEKAMSFRTSFAVIAFVLTAVQGCASPSLTGSSAKEPAPSFGLGLGALGADAPPRVTERQPVERSAPERATARTTRESIPYRTDQCRRCSN
jgi:hypothetical protein